MATDLVSEISRVVSQEIASRIAANLGVDRATVQAVQPWSNSTVGAADEGCGWS